MTIKVKKLTETATVPTYAHLGDVGMDIYSDEKITIDAGERALIKTGIAIEFKNGYAALLWDKGSIGIGKGLKVMGGVFDAGYRGEYIVCLHNLSKSRYEFEKGDKIAQILFQKVEIPKIEVTSNLSETDRGTGRLGSTGKK